MRPWARVVVLLTVGCGQARPGATSPAPSAERAPSPAPAPPPAPPEGADHLVNEADGDRYWVVYRRADAECDFVRLAAGSSTPSVLFTDGLGDFAETACETSIAVSDDGATLYYLHGDEIRGVSVARPSEVEVLARGERFPRELRVHRGRLVWLTLGGDPYEDDLTGLGAVRAMALPHGAPRDLAGGLTEPLQLRSDGEELVVAEGGEEPRERRVRLE